MPCSSPSESAPHGPSSTGWGGRGREGVQAAARVPSHFSAFETKCSVVVAVRLQKGVRSPIAPVLATKFCLSSPVLSPQIPSRPLFCPSSFDGRCFPGRWIWEGPGVRKGAFLNFSSGFCGMSAQAECWYLAPAPCSLRPAAHCWRGVGGGPTPSLSQHLAPHGNLLPP